MNCTKKSLRNFALTLWVLLLIQMVMGQTQTPTKAKPITIPFEMNMGRIYVDAFVNQRGPFRFMVDTGASGYGRADVRLVKELNLATTGTRDNSDGVNVATVSTVSLDSLSIGQITRRSIEVLSRDYNARASAGAKLLMGIIGRDFFSDRLLTIDYAKSELVISTGSLNAAEPNILRYDAAFIVPFRIGTHAAVGSLDTGSNLEMHLPLEWAKRLGLQNLREAGEGRRANTVFKLSIAESSVPVEIGGNKVTVANAMFSELANRINIGGSFLARNRCVITIDQKEQLIRMRCASS